MPFSATLQFSGKNSTIWSSLSTHSFVGIKRKAQYRVACTSYLIPCSGSLAVAMSVSHNEDSHLLTFHNEGSMFGLQETIVNGRLNTHPSVHTALLVQEVTAQKGVEDMPTEEPCTRCNSCFVKNSAEVRKSSVSAENRESDVHKRRHAWKTGRRLSEETKERIRARTREAMQDPKIRERISKRKEGLTQSLETRLKIKAQMMNFWDLRRKAQKRQESCVREWEELIADAARQGSDGDVVFQWDSYNIIRVELRDAWELQVRKARTGRKSADHRNKISKAIIAKWADPNYRESVRKGLHAFLSSRVAELEEQSKQTSKKTAGDKQNDGALLDDIDTDMVVTPKQQTPDMNYNSVKMSMQLYKDPLTYDRLQKLRQMRASRLFVEERRRKEITQRARVLMAEAKRAADALEAAAIKDKSALAPLLETRRLLAEAARSFEIAGLGIDGLSSALLEVEADEETMLDDSASSGAGLRRKTYDRKLPSTSVHSLL
eukprot:c16876_g1_i2 orf=377-1846(-)